MEELNNILKITAAVIVTEMINWSEDISLPEEDYPSAQIIEVLDDATCPLCQTLDGQIIKRGTQEWDDYHLPSHINCRRRLAWISANETDINDPTQQYQPPAFKPPADELIEAHGHFIQRPRVYEDLRIPAFADTRQVIVRVKNIDGKKTAILDWLVERP